MMKRTLTAVATVLVTAGLLSACATLQPKPAEPSQFLVPVTNQLLTVKIPAREAEAFLILIAVNQGVETWQTADDVSISMRNGVVVGTRGLGFDVIASDVSQTLAALAGRQTGAYPVRRSYLTPDNHIERVTATCTMAPPDAQGLWVESCQSPQGDYLSTYKLDGSGRVTASSQWVGPQVQDLNMAFAVVR